MIDNDMLTLIDDLAQSADLPQVDQVEPMEGRGFENSVFAATLADGSRVVARAFPNRRTPETVRFEVLNRLAVAAPALLAASERGSLYEFVDGDLIGDLVEDRDDTDTAWRHVGAAFRSVHRVKFPDHLVGEVLPDRVELLPAPDARDRIIPKLERAQRVLADLSPAASAAIPALIGRVRDAGPTLNGPATLLHGDVNMWNVLASPTGSTLVDWDSPRIGDPRNEIALLDKHASLFNGEGLPDSFFDGYGAPRDAVTRLLRLVGTVQWAASSDWESFESTELPGDLNERTKQWHRALLDQLDDIDEWMNSLDLP